MDQVRVVITHNPTRLLFPYDLAADAASGAHTPPLLPPSSFNAITRKQVVDVLLRLVRDRVPIDARVQEITLEYIGRKWHATEGDVECIAKKLSEIVSDVSYDDLRLSNSAQVEANEPSRCSIAIATIHRLRFQLGLVSAAQLASRLNTQAAFLRDDCCPSAGQLIHTWAVRRLNASQLPQSVAEALFHLRDLLHHAPHQDAVKTVLSSFGLDGRRTSGKESPPRTRNRITSRSFQSPPRVSPTKRRTMPFPHWLPRNSARFNTSDEGRRPSLPTLLTPAEPTQISWPIPMQGDGQLRPSPDGSPCHTPTPTAGGSHSALLDPSAVRVAVVDQILELRYRLGADCDGWFLGTGQDKAAEIVNHFPDSEELRDTLFELRRIFKLPDPAVSNKLGLTMMSPSTEVDPLVQPRRIGLHVTTPSLETTPIIHERDVSFDLDQYMADISCDGPDSSSSTLKPGDEDDSPKMEIMVANKEEKEHGLSIECPGLRAGPGPDTRSSISSEVSHFSFTSTSSALSTASGRRGSTISDFVICEAVRVPVEHESPVRKAQKLTDHDDDPKPLRRHSKSLSMLSDPDLYTRMPELRSRRSPMRCFDPMPAFTAPLSKTEFDFTTADEAPSRRHDRGSVQVPLISPTPRTSPNGVDFSISPILSPFGSPPGTARPAGERHTAAVSGPPSPPPTFEPSSSSVRAPSYQRLSASPIERADSRTPTVSSPDDRSRRHRQMVIVDGEPISPGSNKTPLGVILTLFSQRSSLTPDAVEQMLEKAVQCEEERMTAQGEEFDVEARVRLAWLLEEVANEVSVV